MRFLRLLAASVDLGQLVSLGVSSGLNCLAGSCVVPAEWAELKLLMCVRPLLEDWTENNCCVWFYVLQPLPGLALLAAQPLLSSLLFCPPLAPGAPTHLSPWNSWIKDTVNSFTICLLGTLLDVTISRLDEGP